MQPPKEPNAHWCAKVRQRLTEVEQKIAQFEDEKQKLLKLLWEHQPPIDQESHKFTDHIKSPSPSSPLPVSPSNQPVGDLQLTAEEMEFIMKDLETPVVVDLIESDKEPDGFRPTPPQPPAANIQDDDEEELDASMYYGDPDYEQDFVDQWGQSLEMIVTQHENELPPENDVNQIIPSYKEVSIPVLGTSLSTDLFKDPPNLQSTTDGTASTTRKGKKRKIDFQSVNFDKLPIPVLQKWMSFFGMKSRGVSATFMRGHLKEIQKYLSEDQKPRQSQLADSNNFFKSFFESNEDLYEKIVCFQAIPLIHVFGRMAQDENFKPETSLEDLRNYLDRNNVNYE